MSIRENVTKARWPLPRSASRGVVTVMKPQAEADSKMTFSPPMLEETQGETECGGGCLRGLSSSIMSRCTESCGKHCRDLPCRRAQSSLCYTGLSLACLLHVFFMCHLRAATPNLLSPKAKPLSKYLLNPSPICPSSPVCKGGTDHTVLGDGNVPPQA